MRRVAVVVALVASSIACGGILGFGNDDDEPAPASDGGSDVSTADGGSTVDADAADATPSEICVTKTVVVGTDAGVAGPDWSPGVNTVQGGGSFANDNGTLVARTGPGDAGATAAAEVFATRSGQLSRIHCTMRVASTSFADEGRLFQFRIEGPKWQAFYDVRVDWSGGVFRMARQARPVGQSSDLEDYPSLPTPSAGTKHDLVADLILGDTPTFTLAIDGDMHQMSPPAAGTITRTQVAIGTIAYDPFVPHEVSYESVVCDMCVAP